MVAGLEIWVMVFLKIVFAILGCAFVVTRITPLAKSFIRDSIKGQKAVAAFIYIINVFIISYYVMLCCAMLYYMYYILSCHVISYHIILCII